VREGAVIPHAGAALSVDEMDWSRIQLTPFGRGPFRPAMWLSHHGAPTQVRLREEAPHGVVRDPSAGTVTWTVTTVGNRPRDSQ
jgi:hypothetical protein